MTRQIRWTSSLALCVSLVVFTGCGNLIGGNDQGNKAPSKPSTITMNLSAVDSTARNTGRTIVPSTPTVTGYKLYGAQTGGAAGASLTLLASFDSLASASVGLDAGTWDFTLKATVADGTTVLQGTKTAVALTTSPTAVDFTLEVLTTSTGSVTVGLSWPSGANVASVVTTYGSATVSPALTIAASGGTSGVSYGDTKAPAGKALLSFQLLDAGSHTLATVSDLVVVGAGLDSTDIIALVLTDFNAAPQAPTGFASAIAADATSVTTVPTITLTWADNSNNETGFEIWNGDESSKLASLGPAVVTWSDTTALDRGTTRSYKLKAVNDFGSSVSVTANATASNAYSVTFDSQSGSEVSPQIVEQGKKASVPTAPTKASTVFGGWYTESACSTSWDFAANTVTAATTLYAKWTPLYTVTFDSQGGSAVSSQTVQQGNKASVPTAPTKSATVFGGWYTESGCTTAWDFAVNTVSAPTTVYAKWSPAYAVTFDSQSATTSASPASKMVAQNTAMGTLPTAPAKTGEKFAGWWTGAGATGSAISTSTTVTADLTVYANWVLSDANTTSDTGHLIDSSVYKGRVSSDTFDGKMYLVYTKEIVTSTSTVADIKPTVKCYDPATDSLSSVGASALPDASATSYGFNRIFVVSATEIYIVANTYTAYGATVILQPTIYKYDGTSWSIIEQIWHLVGSSYDVYDSYYYDGAIYFAVMLFKTDTSARYELETWCYNLADKSATQVGSSELLPKDGTLPISGYIWGGLYVENATSIFIAFHFVADNSTGKSKVVPYYNNGTDWIAGTSVISSNGYDYAALQGNGSSALLIVGNEGDSKNHTYSMDISASLTEIGLTEIGTAMPQSDTSLTSEVIFKSDGTNSFLAYQQVYNASGSWAKKHHVKKLLSNVWTEIATTTIAWSNTMGKSSKSAEFIGGYVYSVVANDARSYVDGALHPDIYILRASLGY